ncbi:MAG: uracil-DNA glycosylase family protein [Marinicella sp.]
MKSLLQNIGQCQLCLAYLPDGVRPVVRASVESRILIIGQAPGRKVHETGIPWNDPSGDQLRNWLGVSKDQFYNEQLFALMPMGFCYPGKGKSGDLPPRKECAPKWHPPLITQMPNIKLTLLVGQYAQNHYLSKPHKTLTENVSNFQNYLPTYFPLPHPSPRNRYWQKQNLWFNHQVIPELKKIIREFVKI